MRLSLSFLLALQLLSLQDVLAIWPAPTSISSGTQTLLLSHNFGIVLDLPSPPQDLKDAIERTKDNLFADSLGRLVIGRGSSDSPSFDSAQTLHTLRLSLTSTAIKSISEEAIAPLDIRNETYSLIVPANGRDATLTAPTTLGLLRGLTTFEQLWYTYAGRVYAINGPLSVYDAPAYVSQLFPLDCRHMLM